MASPFDLCDDLLKIEIFSRTTMQTFNAMRCVSKQFDSLSYNRLLKSLRTEYTNDFSGFLMQNLDSTLNHTHAYAPARGTPTLALDILPANSNLLCASENGLVVFEWIRPFTPELVTYHVSKPASSQVVAIPNPNLDFPTLNMCIVTLSTRPFRYKILRISECRVIKSRGDVYSPVRLELFDSRSWEWQEFDWVFMDHGVYPLTTQPIVVSGCVNVLFSDMSILSFDMYSESLSSIVPPLPFGVIPGYLPKISQLVKIDRSLGFARKGGNDVWTVWVLERGVRWKRIFNLPEQQIPVKHQMEFDDPSCSMQIGYNLHLFFKGENVVDNVAPSPGTLFVFKSDSDHVNLAGGP